MASVHAPGHDNSFRVFPQSEERLASCHAVKATLSLQAFGRVAQLAEQLTLNQRVRGSSPRAPSNDLQQRDFANTGERI